MYGGYGEVKVNRGKEHDYLGMHFTYGNDGTVKIHMKHYVNDMVDNFPTKITGTVDNPAAEDLFAAGSGPQLDKNRAEAFHTFVAKGLFVCKQTQPDT